MLIRYLIRLARGTNQQVAPNSHPSSGSRREHPGRGPSSRPEQHLTYGGSRAAGGYYGPQPGSTSPGHQAGSGYQSNNSYPPGHSDLPKKSTWAVWAPRLRLVAGVFLPVILDTLDYTIVATAQTNIASVFDRLDLQSYIGTAYVLGSTVFLPIWASISDIFGRFWAMQASLFIFLVGSALSTGASSMIMLLVGRGISGVGAAGLLSIVRIILSDSASLDDNNIQGAMMIVMYAVGYSVGPILGGVLLRTSWRWVFGINLPVGAASIVIMWILLRNHTKGPQPPARFKRIPSDIASDIQRQMGTGFWGSVVRVDFIGAFLFMAFGILILLGLNWGSTGAWNDLKVIICLAVSAASLLIFIVWEYLVDHSTDHLAHEAYYADLESPPNGHNVRSPLGNRARAARLTPSFTRITDAMIPMSMFRSYDIIATDFSTMASGMIMLGVFYFVAIFYVIVGGSDPVHAGTQLLYFAPGLGIGAVVANQLIRRLRQPKYSIWLASIVLPIGVGFLAQALYNNEGQVKSWMIVSGVGVGLGFGPLSYQARYSQPEDRVAIVVATNLFFRSFGGTVGLAQLSAVMYSRVRTYIAEQVTSGAITVDQALQITASLSSVDSSSGIFGLPKQLQDIISAAFKDGLRWAFFSLLPWLVLAAVLCCFLSTIPEERMNAKPGEQQEGEEKD